MAKESFISFGKSDVFSRYTFESRIRRRKWKNVCKQKLSDKTNKEYLHNKYINSPPFLADCWFLLLVVFCAHLSSVEFLILALLSSLSSSPSLAANGQNSESQKCSPQQLLKARFVFLACTKILSYLNRNNIFEKNEA